MSVASGMALALIVAEIDLSVSSVLGLCGAVIGAAMTQWHWPALLAGAVTGAVFSGWVSGRWRLP
jgi:ribose/xylose/arabinose/galactoside ABC-type transport system permease subunit